MILLDKVSIGYEGRETPTELSAGIAPGSLHFLTEPSGAGKATGPDAAGWVPLALGLPLAATLIARVRAQGAVRLALRRMP